MERERLIRSTCYLYTICFVEVNKIKNLKDLTDQVQICSDLKEVSKVLEDGLWFEYVGICNYESTYLLQICQKSQDLVKNRKHNIVYF